MSKTKPKMKQSAMELAEAFQKLVEWHKPRGKWKFTYSVSLSAEPIPDLEHEKVSDE